jgi:hypothetical protein
MCDETALAVAANAQNASAPSFRGFVQAWRASRNKTANMYVIEIAG